MRHIALALIAGGLAASPIAAGAGTIAYTTPAGTVGEANFPDASGMDFSSTLPVFLTQTGLSSSGISEFGGMDYVTLYDPVSQTVVARLTFTPPGPGTAVAGAAGSPAPLNTAMAPGTGLTYSIVSYYTSGTDGFSNSAILSEQTGNGDTSPITGDAGPDQLGDPPAVPEPASFTLLGTALAGFGLMRRRKTPGLPTAAGA